MYRQLFNPELYEHAYANIYSNLGATTRGSDNETLDGMSKRRMKDIIQKVKTETYRWKPVRRTYIPKENGKSRPLGIPTGRDKMLQAAMKTLLEAYYEHSQTEATASDREEESVRQKPRLPTGKRMPYGSPTGEEKA